MYQNSVYTIFCQALVSVSFKGAAVGLPCRCARCISRVANREERCDFNSFSAPKAALLGNCFCTLYFSPEKPETDDVGKGKHSALSRIMALFWYQRVISRRLKLILALSRPTSSSGNSKPMQIAEGRSHEGIR